MEKVTQDFRLTFKQMDDDALLDADEFGQLLKINKQGVYHRLHKKQLVKPVIHRNKQVRWKAADVREFLRSLCEVREIKPGANRPGRPRTAIATA